jgi:uncharacterized protein (TIGR00730 family)
MKNILVFCSANDLEEKYTDPARKFARLIPRYGYGLVWGGSNTGLMKIMADTVQGAGGRIYGVSVKLLEHKARPSEQADEMIIAKDWPERKATMLEKSEAIVVMPGGIGTLDEITDIMEQKKHNIHTKPIVFLNTDNFYEGFKIQLKKMFDEGFLTQSLDDMVFFTNTPQETIDYINKELA